MASKTKILMAFGEIIREKRKEKGLSQEDLAFKADLHRTYIGMIERAEKNITLENINKLSNALDTPIYSLFQNITQ
jgi:transcriptional regulator with XRE-family HTH domain